MLNIETDLFKLSYVNKDNTNINLQLEIYRGELYCELLKKFTSSCLKNLDEPVFSHKKNYTRTITNMLASWFFTCYQKNDFELDDFFPSNYLDNDIIIERVLVDYCSLHTDIIKNIDEKIKNIINDLHAIYSSIISKLQKYTSTSNTIYIKKYKNTHTRNNKNIIFYTFNINNNSYICNKLNNVINNIMIPVDQYDIMQNKYNGPDNMMDTIIWIILFRYQLLSSNNNQLAILPTIYKKMEEDFGLSVECFASAINSSSDYFCSLYYDVEKYFGSIGNFFNIIPIKGTYSFNPPYQYDVITNGIKKILEHLSNSSNIKEELSFIITIPIWDNYGKDYMAQNMVENNNNIIKYDEFEIMNEIRNSKYFKGLRMISKEEFTYMDHNFYLFKNKTIQNTYVIVMSNYECNFIDKINKYNFYSY
jgi:hypothetical protein